jgi:hypothetical protein
MTWSKACVCAVLFLGSISLSPALLAQTNCEAGNGPLRAVALDSSRADLYFINGSLLISETTTDASGRVAAAPSSAWPRPA